MERIRMVLSGSERTLIGVSCGITGSAIAVVVRDLLKDHHPFQAWISFFATTAFLFHALLRYFVSARIYQTERTLYSWVLSMLFPVTGAVTFYTCLYGSYWFWSVVSLCFLADLKVVQSKTAIKQNHYLPLEKKIMYGRLQDGLISIQTSVGLAMIMIRVLVGRTFGDYIAKHAFGVSEIAIWRHGVGLLGVSLCLAVTTYVTIRLVLWNREDLR